MEHTYVCYVADKNVESSLWISIYSLIQHTNDEDKYTLFIIDAGLTSHFAERLSRAYATVSHVEIQFIKADHSAIHDIPPPRNVGRAVYHKLIIPDFIPPQVNKLVYLDTDTLVLRDIRLLYQHHVGNNVLLGVQEYSSPLISQTKSKTGLLDIVDFPNGRHYYNSGVLVMNLDRWKETDVTRRSIRLLLDHYDRLTVDDQDALNGTIIDEWDTLNPSWNAQINGLVEENKTIKYHDLIGSPTHGDLFETPCIIHFNHHPKPAHPAYRGPFRDLYISYERRSDYFSPLSFRFRDVLRYVAPTVASAATLSKSLVGSMIDASRPYRHRLARRLPRSLRNLLKRDAR